MVFFFLSYKVCFTQVGLVLTHLSWFDTNSSIEASAKQIFRMCRISNVQYKTNFTTVRFEQLYRWTARSLKCSLNIAIYIISFVRKYFTDVQLLMHQITFGFKNAQLLCMFSDYETRVCECVLHKFCWNDCSKSVKCMTL